MLDELLHVRVMKSMRTDPDEHRKGMGPKLTVKK